MKSVLFVSLRGAALWRRSSLLIMSLVDLDPWWGHVIFASGAKHTEKARRTVILAREIEHLVYTSLKIGALGAVAA